MQSQRSTIKHADAVGAGGGSIGTGMQRLVALVGEVEGGRVSLAPLRMEHPLLGTTALQQQVYSHYMRAALPELVKLVGSANVLGAPLFPTGTHPDPLRPHVPPRASLAGTSCQRCSPIDDIHLERHAGALQSLGCPSVAVGVNRDSRMLS